MSHSNALASVSLLVIAALGAVSPASAATPACGSTIGPGAGTVVFDSNPNCSTGPGTSAFTVVGPGTVLDMNHHYITQGVNSPDFGITITGSGAIVKNGR